MDLIRKCIRFREMLSSLTRRELRQRYIGSIIGWPWPFLQPLIMLGVYYIVFVKLLEQKVPAEWGARISEALGGDSAIGDTFSVLLLCCGLLPWLMTAEFLVRSSNTIPENGNLVKKVAFPAELLSISLISAYTVNLVVIFAVFCGITWFTTPFISNLVWMFPLVLICHVAFLLGLGYLLSTANVFVRDVNQLAPLVINLWFFLTPIVYVKESILYANPDAGWVWIFDINPMAYMVDLYRYTLIFPEEIRWTVIDGKAVDVTIGDVWSLLGLFAAISFGTLIVGYLTFMAKKDKFADEI
ncbi:MAG: lipopolysaccharide transport system permease protein [Planctomycetota bacterium]|jgi:lipopolysaccharide transport system permease protein